MKRFLPVFLVLCLFPLIAHSDEDQVHSYTRKDRAALFAESLKQQEFLKRLAELAELGASGRFSSSQLMALASEFSAILQAGDQEASRSLQILTPQSNAFRSAEFSSTGLGLFGAALDTSATPAGQLANRLVLDRVNSGITHLLLRVAGGWEPVAINGSPNAGNCAGGYSPRDAEFVRSGFADAARQIMDAYDGLNKVITQPLSRPGRDEVNFHLQFIKGEIELLGETSRFGRVRSRTERFFRTVVDPLYCPASAGNEHFRNFVTYNSRPCFIAN